MTNRPAATKGSLGRTRTSTPRTGSRPGWRTRSARAKTPRWAISHMSFDFKVNAAWLTAAMIAAILLAWLKLLALDGDLAKAEPKTLRVPRTARRRPPGTRRAAPPPENPGDLAVGRGDHGRVAAYRCAPASPLTSTDHPCDPGRDSPRGLWNPRPPGAPAGPPSYPGAKTLAANGASRPSAPAINPDERSGLVFAWTAEKVITSMAVAGVPDESSDLATALPGECGRE